MPPTPPLRLKWQTEDLCLALDLHTAGDVVPLPEFAPIPSPVANFGSQEEACVALVDETASPAVKELFHLIKSEREKNPQFRDAMARDEDGLAEYGKYGLVGYIDEAETAQDGVGPRTDWDVSRRVLQLKRVEDVFILRVDAKEPLYHLMPGSKTPVVSRITTPIDIRRLDNTTSDRRVPHGFFIVNLSKTSVTINKLVIRPNRIAGPLPNFAVIEFGEAAAFWWHSRSARDYIPVDRLELRERRARDPQPQPGSDEATTDLSEDLVDLAGAPARQRSARTEPRPLRRVELDPSGDLNTQEADHEDEHQEVEDEEPHRNAGLQVEPTPSLSWLEQLRLGLRGWRTIKAGKATKKEFKQSDILQVDMDSLANCSAVSAAIAAITMGQGNQRKFAYGSTLSFRKLLESGERLPGSFICDRQYPLLMPLWLQSKEDKIKTNSIKGNVWPHIKSTSGMILAIARHAPPGAGFDVEIRIWNPQWDRLKPYFAQQDSMVLIQHSDWIEGVPAKQKLKFDVTHEQVPQAADLTFSTIHVVLTAWAYALNYPLSPLRGNIIYNESFYAEALELINLALAGCMDGKTIVAFLNAHNYGAWYNGANEAVPVLRPQRQVKARPMKGGLDAFDRLVEEKLRGRKAPTEKEKGSEKTERRLVQTARKTQTAVVGTRATGKRKRTVQE